MGAIVVDPVGNKLYFTAAYIEAITIDGSNRQTLIPVRVYSLVVDPKKRYNLFDINFVRLI